MNHFPRRVILCAVGLAAGSVIAPRVARAEVRQQPTPVSVAGATCDAIFGSAGQRAAHRGRRESSLYWVDARGDRVLVAHGDERWDTPRRLEMTGLRLMAVDSGRGEATVEVSPELARRASCTAGRYRIGVDHGLGQGAAVLALLPTGLLVSRHGRVGFLAAVGQRAPEWMMVWGSRFELKPPADGATDSYVRYGRGYLRHATID